MTATDEQPTLDASYNADECTYDFAALRDYFRRAVPYALTHATGSSEGWRTASVEQLTEWMTDFLTAGITPTLSSEAVNSGVKVARQFLADERAKNAASAVMAAQTHDEAPQCRECGTWPCGRHATAEDIAEYEARGGAV